MASWEDEDFEPAIEKNAMQVSDKWDDEDVDDEGIKDNWEDEDDEEEEKKAPVIIEKPKKKPLAERIKEKEEAKKIKRQELQEKKAQEEEDNKDMTPEEILAEKLKKQRLIEEADLLIAQETFGVKAEVIPGQKTIDTFDPSTKEDFTEFSRLLAEKITHYESKPHYVAFLESLFRDTCAGLDPDDIKKISSMLNVLATEKSKALKGGKSKKKTTKKALVGGSAKIGKRDDFANYGDQFDDFDDFM